MQSCLCNSTVCIIYTHAVIAQLHLSGFLFLYVLIHLDLSTTTTTTTTTTTVFSIKSEQNCCFYLPQHLNSTATSVLLFFILVIFKSYSHFADVRFCNNSYDYRPNWTPLSPITIINSEVSGKQELTAIVTQACHRRQISYNLPSKLVLTNRFLRITVQKHSRQFSC